MNLTAPRARVALFVVLASCSRPPDASGGNPRGAPAGEGRCEPAAMGLAHARVLSAWRAPAGCAPRGGGSAPTALRSEAEFASRYACPPGVNSGVDWSQNSLWSMQTTLSPAGAGFAVFAEGHRVTLVARMRSPCPDDPRPMPMPYAFAFLGPADPDVTVTETTCTLPAQCR